MTDRSVRFSNFRQEVFDCIVIFPILLVAALVVGTLRFKCLASRQGHDWESFPGDGEFVPQLPDECRRCGKERAPTQE